MIYTSYFANSNKLNGIVPIGIALKSPFRVKEYKALAPRREMLSMSIPEYIQEYQKILNSLDASKVYDDLLTLSNGKTLAMLCYEKPKQFCHRHLAAEWLSNQLGIEVIEYTITPTLF